MAGSQSLFDTLAGAFGHGVDRPALESFVANSQSMNGLRSAQTEEALNNAQKQQEEMQAHADLENSLSGVLGDDGKPLLAPSQVHLVANEMKGHFGDAKSVMQALRETQGAHNTGVISNPANLDTPQMTAALAGNTNKAPEAALVPNEYSVPAGMKPPVVQQTPLGAAETSEHLAGAGLRTLQAVHPELFHTPGGQSLDPQTAAEVAEFIRQNPNLAGNLRSLVSNGGSAVVHAFMHPESVGAPPGLQTPAQLGAQPLQVQSTKGGKSGAADPNASGAANLQPNPASQPSAVTPLNGILPAPGVSLREQAQIRGDFAAGMGAKQTSALNTMGQHARLFQQIGDQLQNGNVVPTNEIAQLWAKTFGSAVPGNLKIAAGFLGREAIKATVNSGAGTGAERELDVGPDATPDQIHGAAQTLLTLAGGQLHSLENRARRGGVDITQLLDPEMVQAFARSNPREPQQSSTLPAYPDEAAALAAGHKAGDRVMIGGVTGTLQ